MKITENELLKLGFVYENGFYSLESKSIILSTKIINDETNSVQVYLWSGTYFIDNIQDLKLFIYSLDVLKKV